MKRITAPAAIPLGLPIISCGGVELHDLHSGLIFDASEVNVGVEGTGYGATTDASGTWHIDGLPTVTDTITHSRPGLAPTRTPGYQFTGGGFAPSVLLGEQSTTRTTSLTATICSQEVRLDTAGSIDTVSLGEPGLFINATFSEPMDQVTVFFDSSPSIAPDSGRYRAVHVAQFPEPTSAATIMLTLTRYPRDDDYHSGGRCT